MPWCTYTARLRQSHSAGQQLTRAYSIFRRASGLKSNGSRIDGKTALLPLLPVQLLLRAPLLPEFSAPAPARASSFQLLLRHCIIK